MSDKAISRSVNAMAGAASVSVAAGTAKVATGRPVPSTTFAPTHGLGGVMTMTGDAEVIRGGSPNNNTEETR